MGSTEIGQPRELCRPPLDATRASPCGLITHFRFCNACRGSTPRWPSHPRHGRYIGSSVEIMLFVNPYRDISVVEKDAGSSQNIRMEAGANANEQSSPRVPAPRTRLRAPVPCVSSRSLASIPQAWAGATVGGSFELISSGRGASAGAPSQSAPVENRGAAERSSLAGFWTRASDHAARCHVAPVERGKGCTLLVLPAFSRRMADCRRRRAAMCMRLGVAEQCARASVVSLRIRAGCVLRELLWYTSSEALRVAVLTMTTRGLLILMIPLTPIAAMSAAETDCF